MRRSQMRRPAGSPVPAYRCRSPCVGYVQRIQSVSVVLRGLPSSVLKSFLRTIRHSDNWTFTRLPWEANRRIARGLAELLHAVAGSVSGKHTTPMQPAIRGGHLVLYSVVAPAATRSPRRARFSHHFGPRTATRNWCAIGRRPWQPGTSASSFRVSATKSYRRAGVSES